MTAQMGNTNGMITPAEAASRALASFDSDYQNFESQGSFKGEFMQNWLFGLMPIKFVQKMMLKGILKMIAKRSEDRF